MTSSNETSLSNKLVFLHSDRVAHPSATDFPYDSTLPPQAWNLHHWLAGIEIVISHIGKEDMEFDLISVDAALANALRRIMIGEVPTMAIEKFYVMNNTSIMHDEILAQRLGLVPIKADPRLFEFRRGEDDPPTDLNTIVFKLSARCEANENAPVQAVHPDEKYVNANVYTSHLEWIPQGEQDTRFKHDPIRPVHNDILLTKLRPGQEIELELHCQKGIGKEHAKWSPVATASYRLLPQIQLLRPVTNEAARELVSCFPTGVIETRMNAEGITEAFVANPRKDTMSREVLRHPNLKDAVRLSRVRDHFIFSVESTGALPPQVLVVQAAKCLGSKCRTIKSALQELLI
ncbi:DNA-directed RNA polymerase [Phlyctochytrium arcticum]|nr:DNA-directed RNA polymerase [Phlyctochytrium arcticum]